MATLESKFIINYSELPNKEAEFLQKAVFGQYIEAHIPDEDQDEYDRELLLAYPELEKESFLIYIDDETKIAEH